MGYHYDIDVGSFLSLYTPEKCNEIREMLIEEHAKFDLKIHVLEAIEFTGHQREDGLYVIDPDLEELESKWGTDAEYALAFLISLLIAKGDSMDMLMDGEDGCKWGYKIQSMAITELACKWVPIPSTKRKFKKEDLFEALV